MSIVKWLTGNLTGGDAASTARLDAALTALYQTLAPGLRDGSLRSLAITSAEVGEGRSTSACYLAEAIATNHGQPVLLIDGDAGRPRLHELYGLANETGLTEILAGETTLAPAARATLHERLDLLPFGAGRLPDGETGRPALNKLLGAAKRKYAATVIDTGPVLGQPDALWFCAAVDAVVLVVLVGSTQGEIAAQARRLLQRNQANLIGVLLNDPRGEFQSHER